MGPPKYVHDLIAGTYKSYLTWTKHLAGMIKDLDMRRSSCIIWMGHKSKYKCPCKREDYIDTKEDKKAI